MPPTRPQLRQQLRVATPTVSDLHALLVDYFPSIARRVSAGMDRLSIENLLIEAVPEQQIAAVLRELTQAEPQTTPVNPSRPETSGQTSTTAIVARPRLVFLVQAQDRLHYQQLLAHIAALSRESSLELFSPFDVSAGTRLDDEMQRAISEASVILCLLSADYLADSQQRQWLEAALVRVQIGQARLLPILVRPVLLDSTPFAEFQSLPRSGKAIAQWPNRDEAWTEVVREIDRALRLTRSADPPSEPVRVAPVRLDTPIGSIFPLNGVPKYTFVEPEEYGEIAALLGNPEMSFVLEGPSGIGKTTLLRMALADKNVPYDWYDAGVLARRHSMQSRLDGIGSGAEMLTKPLVIDDGQMLESPQLQSAAQAIYSCSLGPDEQATASSQPQQTSPPDGRTNPARGQIAIVGLPGVRSALLANCPPDLRSSLPRRIKSIPMHSCFSEERVRRLEALLVKGEEAANIKFARPDELIRESGGSYLMLQYLCQRSATLAGVQQAQRVQTRITVPIGDVIDAIMRDLRADFEGPLHELARLDAVSPPRGAVLALLFLLSRPLDEERESCEVSIEEARLAYPVLHQAFDWLLEGPLQQTLVQLQSGGLPLTFELQSRKLRVQDPRLEFFLRHLSWRRFLEDTGHRGVTITLEGQLLFAPAVGSSSPAPDSAPTTAAARPAEPSSSQPGASSAAGSVISQELPPIPADLVRAVQEGKLIPFAGAGVSMAVREQGSEERLYPSWGGLLEKLAVALDQQGRSSHAQVVRGLTAIGDHGKLLDAASTAREGLGDRLFYECLRRALLPERRRVSERSLDLARLLWQLNSQLVVTTNYDRTLRWACPEDVRDDLQTWYVTAPPGFAEYLRNGLNHPTLWHLHGSIERPEELILTSDGYHRLYPATPQAVSEEIYTAALRTLTYLFAARTLLFVGFSFTDQTFANQLAFDSQLFSGSTGPHYLLVQERDYEHTRERLRGMSMITLLPYKSHGDPLLRLLRQIAASVSPGRS
jgi:hypothetical protein